MKHIAFAAIAIALGLGLPATTVAEPLHSTGILKQGQYSPPKPKKGFRYPDCFCTDSGGQRVEMGKTACLKIGSQSFLAKCDMSLNNPTWRRISEGCPSV